MKDNMVPASGQPGPSGEQRVKCLYCGANNFARSVSCWQCGRSLVALREPAGSNAGLSASSAANDTRALMGDKAFAQPPPGPRPSGFSSLGAVAMNAAATASRSTKTAALLGLAFPWIGLPVGMIFLMLDDDRKAQIGWITIGWSLFGTAINIIGGLILLGPLLSGLHSLIPSGSLHAPGGNSSSPSLPDLGGDGLNMLCPSFIIRTANLALQLLSALF